MLGDLALVCALFGADFSICKASDFQDYTDVEYAEDLFYVFWIDRRSYFTSEKFAIYGARVSSDGHVVDPDGKLLYCDSTADGLDVVRGPNDLFVVSRNHC